MQEATPLRPHTRMSYAHAGPAPAPPRSALPVLFSHEVKVPHQF